MHRLYWRDLLRPATQEWQGLAVQVEGAYRAPFALRLQSGGDNRIRLAYGEQPLLWATLLPGYEGVWLVKSLARIPAEQACVPPINSPTLESLRGLRGEARYKAWSRYFAEALRDSPGSCLEAGRWLLRLSVSNKPAVAKPSQDLQERLKSWRYSSFGDDSVLPSWSFYGLVKALDCEPVQWLDWWNESDALLSLRSVEDNDGRVKWWRKKAREGELPPLLVLHLNCLDACVILDGHCRLRAALLENIPPEIFVLSSYNELVIPPDMQRREQVLQALAQCRDTPTRGRRPLNTEQINQVLLKVFDDRPLLQLETHARAVLKEEDWCAQVSSWLTAQGCAEDLPAILQRL